MSRMLSRILQYTLYDGQSKGSINHLWSILHQQPDVQTVTAGQVCRQLQADSQLAVGSQHSSQPGLSGVWTHVVGEREGGGRELTGRGGEEEGRINPCRVSRYGDCN